jgi:integrase
VQPLLKFLQEDRCRSVAAVSTNWPGQHAIGSQKLPKGAEGADGALRRQPHPRRRPDAWPQECEDQTEGYATLSEHHIAAFERQHAIGSRARLALALLLYTGQRRSDVVRLGRQHVRNGVLFVRQQKTGTTSAIPVHPVLQTVLDATPGDLTFLTTHDGRPFSPAGFGNVFRDWCREAGLPRGLSAHGLRKACCTRLAEAGCSEKQIAAISGHASLAEVARYTRAADQQRLARSAMDIMTATFSPTRTSEWQPSAQIGNGA